MREALNSITMAESIQGSHNDFLICAVAYSLDLQIFSTDKDFIQFKKVLPIKLFSPNRPE